MYVTELGYEVLSEEASQVIAGLANVLQTFLIKTAFHKDGS